MRKLILLLFPSFFWIQKRSVPAIGPISEFATMTPRELYDRIHNDLKRHMQLMHISRNTGQLSANLAAFLKTYGETSFHMPSIYQGFYFIRLEDGYGIAVTMFLDDEDADELKEIVLLQNEIRLETIKLQ